MYPRACPISQLKIGDVYSRPTQTMKTCFVITPPRIKFVQFGPNFALEVLQDGKLIYIETADESVWLISRDDQG